MPGYVEAALHKFQHPWLACLEDSPFENNIPQYGTKDKLTDPIDTSPLLQILQTNPTGHGYLFILHTCRQPNHVDHPNDISSQQSCAMANMACALTKYLVHHI